MTQIPTNRNINSHRFPENHPDEVRIYSVNIPAESHKIDYYRELIPEKKVLRYEKYRFEKDRTSRIVIHGLLRSLLADYLTLSPPDLKFRQNEFGKPYLDDEIYFSISYAGEIGMIAISRVEIGIDIVKIAPEPAGSEMLNAFMTREEREYYNNLDLNRREDAFFQVWARKESIIKAWGVGMSYPLTRLHTFPGEDACVTSYRDSFWRTRDLITGNSLHRAALTRRL
jgi:4'-phosphopantetheinyl transferase